MENIKDILVVIYSLSSLGLLIVAIIGLKQIVLAKKSIIINSKRESGTLAANQVIHYMDYIIPMLDEFDIELKKIDCPKYNGEIKTYTNKDLKQYSIEWYKKYLNCIIKNKPDIKAINALEAFATFFTSKMADEAIAYGSVGTTFCNTIKQIYPFICQSSLPNQSKYYNNIIRLHKMWQARLDKESLENKENEVLRKLENIKAQKIDPIGTE